MKHLVLFIALLGGFTFTFSQGVPQTADQKADEVVTKLKNDIQLTEEQVPKVKTITLDRITKVTDATKKYGKDKNRLNAAKTKIFDEWEAQLKTIVTEDQFKKYLASKGK
jgi:hypothetical protein